MVDKEKEHFQKVINELSAQIGALIVENTSLKINLRDGQEVTPEPEDN
jgi:hypothetical protein